MILEATKVEGEVLQAKIDTLNNRLHLMAAKIEDIKKRGQSYFSSLDRNLQRRSVDQTLELLEEEKAELCGRRRSHQLDLETVWRRRQEMEEDYSMLVEKETILVDGWRGEDEVDC